MRSVLVLAALVFGLNIACAQTPPITLFGAAPEMARPSLSPDGRYLAFLSFYEDETILRVHDRETLQPLSAIRTPDASKIFGFRWAGSERLIVMARFPTFRFGTPISETRAIAMRPDGSEMVVLLEDIVNERPISNITTFFVDMLIEDNDLALLQADLDVPRFVGQGDQDGAMGVYRVNLRTGGYARLESGSRNTRGFLADWDHQIRFRFDIDGLERTLFYRSKGESTWRQIPKGSGSWLKNEVFDPIGFSSDNNSIYALTNVRGREALTRINLVSGHEELLFAHDRVDVSGADIGPRGELLWAFYTVDMPERHFFDPEEKRFQALLDQTFPSQDARWIDRSNDERFRIARASGPGRPPTYYLFDREKMALQLIGSAYPQLAEVQLGAVQSISYTARDGLEIPAYLTLPPGKEPVNLPLVVLPHGGPSSRDTMDFDWLRQALATRGYAVVQPNFRGSTGYGALFFQAGLKRWGLEMQDDVTDAALHLVDQGIANPDRICIMGWSYGGYATLMGLVKEPELFRCGVSVAGVSDLVEILRESRRYIGGYDFWSETMGSLADDKEHLISVSPARQAHRMKAPVLLIHGKDDRVAPYDESKKFAKKYEKAGGEVELILLKDGDHSLTLKRNRIAMLEAAERFLDKHLGE